MEIIVILFAVGLLYYGASALLGAGEAATGAGSVPAPSGPNGLPSYPSGGAAMNLSPSDIVVYARNAGFTGADLQKAVAIALAESGGNPVAYNPETAAKAPLGQGSYGLWQIFLHAHPEFQGSDLYDPQTNANAAFSVYQAAGRSFHPWATYLSGMYTPFLPAANQAVNA